MSTQPVTPDLSQPGANAPQTPATPAPGPHAGLLAMVQGLALGVDSFARAAATHGREGGVGEVQAANAQKQQMQIQQQQAQQSQQDFELRQKTMNANLLTQKAALHHALQMYPMEEREANLKVLNDATASYKDAMAEGYDIADPQQAALWRQMQSNIIDIPFSAGQSQQEVLSSATDAAQKNGKNITDFVPLVNYQDGKHGTGGSLTLVPATALQQVSATPRQISMGMAQMKSTLVTAKAALGPDDKDVQGLQGKIDTIQKVIDNGGKPSAYDFISLNSSVIGPLTTRIAGETQASKITQAKVEAQKAASDATISAQKADPKFQVAQAGAEAGAKAKAELPYVGAKAAATAAAQQPFQVKLKELDAPIAEGVASNKEARDAVQGAYVKPFLDKVNAARELLSSLDQAESGNAAASKAAIAKMTGITMPAGAKRVSPEILRQIETQGNVPQQYIGSLKEALTGDRWTSKMSQDMKDFASAQVSVAQDTLRSGVKATNALHNTKIDPEALIQAAGPLNIKPAGPQAGKWGSLIPAANTLTP